ncbi:MAG: lytic transglycosylase domain-containing protein [Alcaligenaceae bacterium]|nr:lytic transglycosylase domain-containing protein [Alcaligenaceae bacterium]
MRVTRSRSGEWLRRCLQGAIHPFGEFVHVSAIYVGIAVLTTLGLSLVLPSMREQSHQLHEVMLTMFQADGEGDESADDRFADPLPDGWAFVPETAPAGRESDRAAAGDQAQDAESPSAQDPAKAAAAPVPQSFMRALRTAADEQDVPGLTAAQLKALSSYLARKYKIAHSVAGALIRATFEVGKKKNLDPQLLLAVIAIESRYNPFAASSVGASGLMQVMPNVHIDKLIATGGGKLAVFNPLVNIEVGSQILADCIKRRGSIKRGLACYVGAVGPGDGGYGARVLAERRRIALASGVPVGKP